MITGIVKSILSSKINSKYDPSTPEYYETFFSMSESRIQYLHKLDTERMQRTVGAVLLAETTLWVVLVLGLLLK